MKETFRSLLSADLEKMVFSAARNKSVPYKRITLRPISLKGSLAFQAEFAFEKKVTHENLSAEEALELCMQVISQDFKQVNARTNAEDVQILAAKPSKPRVTKRSRGGGSGKAPGGTGAGNACTVPGKLDARAVLSHNRVKNYIIPDGEPCDFLIELGVMSSDGKVFPRSYSKFRQINRYLEIVADSLKDLKAGTSRPFRVIDFGCGKAYLTFALYHYLHEMRGMDVEIIGLDLKEDVIDFCGKVAKRLGYDGLKFLHGDIADFESDGADMVVTLHACDTATDYALANAVRWGSRIILSVPCCQHELFKQIKNPLMQPVLRHGILNERFTEILTDGLRGLRLESRGYEVDMIEFTSLEHTARNIMIKAVRHSGNDARAKKAAAEYDRLCEEFGVKPTTSII
jgi:SAM-dependent methyltransferase